MNVRQPDYPAQIMAAFLAELRKIPEWGVVRGRINLSEAGPQLKGKQVIAVVVGGRADLLERKSLGNVYLVTVGIITRSGEGDDLIQDWRLSELRCAVKFAARDALDAVRAGDTHNNKVMIAFDPTDPDAGGADERVDKDLGLQGIEASFVFAY